MSGSGKPGEDTTASRTTSSATRSMLQVKISTQAWMKKRGAKKRHHHLETILKAARGVVIALAIQLVFTIAFATQPQGFARAFLVFVLNNSFGGLMLIILKYYRNAIAAGAMKKRAHNTTGGSTSSDEKTISNTSVVPIAEAKSGSMSEQDTECN
jgi:uncharacterized protein YacL